MNRDVYPTSLSVNGVTAGELEPKQQREFPDPTRFPPPRGSVDTETSCGCLFTTWQDSQQGGGVRLETIWQPLWDTVTVGESGIPQEVSFFQQGGGGYGGTPRTNMAQPGSFAWPKRYHVWEIVLHCEPRVEALFVECDKKWPAMVQMHIGEKIHFSLPLQLFYKPRPCLYRAALCAPLYLPPVQYFRVSLLMGNTHPHVEGRVRCVLNGYLHREIP